MKSDFLFLNTRDELYRIDIHSIVYMESDGNYTNILQKNKLKTYVCMNLSNMQAFLSERLKEKAALFARVGKRHIINLNYIYHIHPQMQKLIMSDGETFAFKLDVSKEALKELKNLLVAVVSARLKDKNDLVDS